MAAEYRRDSVASLTVGIVNGDGLAWAPITVREPATMTARIARMAG